MSIKLTDSQLTVYLNAIWCKNLLYGIHTLLHYIIQTSGLDWQCNLNQSDHIPICTIQLLWPGNKESIAADYSNCLQHNEVAKRQRKGSEDRASTLATNVRKSNMYSVKKCKQTNWKSICRCGYQMSKYFIKTLQIKTLKPTQQQQMSQAKNNDKHVCGNLLTLFFSSVFSSCRQQINFWSSSKFNRAGLASSGAKENMVSILFATN